MNIFFSTYHNDIILKRIQLINSFLGLTFEENKNIYIYIYIFFFCCHKNFKLSQLLLHHFIVNLNQFYSQVIKIS